ncbi:hypothetical protein L226DRAFT_529180 [Lentinus tigrinus ALCF2SS1-7]|uniref:F-box domain-containing protein n=1 Tax=Lentinus tigrinus ALCF2SS1-6 TaxID=1328759 RepID=A0A5C2T3A6_9APHY|nr:hypothetical protein L227DRAFT_568993 [Lentinus tigrinus ALCF2SS1-6]RPD80719.1 hypothetical protein L226DRAFT_529180 [Lentinus tigrinus ALCF2SS1-7]
MEVLPYELLRDIFILACTDGGLTACSLSLVSRHIHDTSRPFRFHSVVLRCGTPSKMANFLATFALERARAPGATPLLKHLYLASPATSSYHWFPRYVHPPNQWPHFSSAFVGHALALLALVATELETLVLVQCPSQFLDPLGRTGFPRLRELTVVGGRDIASGCLEAEVDMPLPLYPRLARLNVVSPTVLMSHWIKHAPNVTHLRVSGSGRQDFIDVDLEQVLLRGMHDNNLESAPVFAHLELFTVQVYNIPNSLLSLRNPRSSDIRGRFTQSAVAEVQTDACGGFDVQPTITLQNVEDLEKTTFHRWMDRVEGGDGWWSLNESLENAVVES